MNTAEFAKRYAQVFLNQYSGIHQTLEQHNNRISVMYCRLNLGARCTDFNSEESVVVHAYISGT